MMKYCITILRRTQKALEKVQGADYVKIKVAIGALSL
jgi:hypothetical protein